ncbi:GAF and ANTAR domain-containing protein [Streptomyces albicerus]|uniref:GAF and ANTAR domain-containing protein n=1 Tax=Streptomyces albicerus TaxID=2569859 RepID=UPI00124B0158|nr:GAF and ANTAR domain-containing protein [Streptomyces albicerus]
MPEQPHEERLAAAFVELADTLAGDFDVTHFLHTLSERCVDLLGIAAAGVILAAPRGGSPEVAGSDARTRDLERDAVDWDEGPCRDCLRTGRPVAGVLLDHPDARAAWPRFAHRARDLGFHSVAAVPLRLRDEVIGALSLFLDEPGAPTPRQLRLGQALADFATIGLLQQRALRQQTLLAEQLETALESRILIEQAKGALAQQRRISVDEAFTLLRGHARSRQRRLSAVAREVLDGTTDLSLSESAE